MISRALEIIAEQITEADGGLECPRCLDAENLRVYAIECVHPAERALVAECQVHGLFHFYVPAARLDEVLLDLKEDEQYQEHQV